MDTDVIIAGAGPAGSACARTAAALGLRALLIDRERFPRGKSCGGGVSPRAVADLDRIFGGRLECSALLGVPRFHLRSHLHPAAGRPDREVRRMSLRSEAPLLHVTCRSKLDAHLVRAAGASGAEILEEAEVVAWGQDGTGVWVNVRAGRDGGPLYRTIQGRYLVGADGAGSMVARGLGLGRPGPFAFCLEVFIPVSRSTAEEFTAGAVDFHFGLIRGGYGWVFPGAAGLAAGVGRLIAGRPGRARSELESALGRLLALYRLEPGHPDTTALRAWLVPLGGCRRQWGRGRVLLAGDAAGVANPLTGEGIGPALRSGEAAARHIAGRLNGDGHGRQTGADAGAERAGAGLAAALGSAGPPDYLTFLRREHHLGQRSRLGLVRAAALLSPAWQSLLFRRSVFDALLREMQRTL